MYTIRKNGATSNILRTKLRSSTTGQGLTGLTSSSSGLIISSICDTEATATTYTQAGSTIETISTLGTFATPTTNKARFKEVDATNHPGLYEFQFANARFAVSGAKLLRITISGVSGMLEKEIVVQLIAMDFDDAVHAGLSAVPNATAGATGGLLIAGSNAATTFATLSSTGDFSVGAFVVNGTDLLSITVDGTALMTELGDIKDATDAMPASVWEYQLEAEEGLEAVGELVVDIYSDTNNLLTRLTSQRAANLDNLDATVGSRLAAGSYTAPDNSNIAVAATQATNAAADAATIKSRITATLFSGITYLSKWLGAIAGKSADTSTLAEIQATTAGAGYNNTTDSNEAIRDRGDAAWTGGGGSDIAIEEQDVVIR